MHTVVNILLHVYAVHAFPVPTPATRPSSADDRPRRPRHSRLAPDEADDIEMDGEVVAKKAMLNGNGNIYMNGHGNGYAEPNGDVVGERRRVADAQEFELDALISEDEDDEARRPKEGLRLR